MLALADGTQNAVYRKGGILEPEGQFQPENEEFFLYPAYDHQKPELVREVFQHYISESRLEQKAGIIRLTHRAKIIQANTVKSLEEIHALQLRHIYTDTFFQQRLAYRPHLPLYVLRLETTPLPVPIEFTESNFQQGCKSWVPVEA